MSRKALAMISFGTTYPDARAAIGRIEQALQHALPEYDVFRAFTSNFVIRKMEREEGVRVPNPEELMRQLAECGYEEVLCQSLHVLPGQEYEKMCAQLAPFRAAFARLAIGRPLLFGAQDGKALCSQMMQSLPALGAEEAYVYMGHGTAHLADAVYSQVENLLRHLGAERVYVGTVEGFPDLTYIRRRLKKHGVRRVTLAPFMIVAGEHARHDLAGDAPDSWKSVLEADGYEVGVNLCGLGDLEAVQNLFVQHARTAQKEM